MAIGGRHRASKWPKKAKNCHFVAINRPGGSKLLDQRGSRLDQVRAHPGQCVGTLSRVQDGHRGRQRVPKWLKKAINGPFVAISDPGGSKMVDQRGSWLDQGRTRQGPRLTLGSQAGERTPKKSIFQLRRSVV